MTEMELYQSWRKNAIDDPDLQSELSAIENDAEAIQDRFYRDLAFGTGGLRGVIGAGTNRMNIYTVRKATQGLAKAMRLMAKTTNRSAPSPAVRSTSPHWSRKSKPPPGLKTPSSSSRLTIWR